MEVLKCTNVVKSFGKFVATNNVSLTVDQGKIFGLLGPNGAGKTTLIRMITNILLPDSGLITLNGEAVSARHQHVIGYLPEERGLYKKLKVMEQIRYFGELKGLSSREAVQRGRAWLNRLEAADWENKKIRELSKGMSQKVQFIATVVHHPPLLILDEPFSGLDPVNVELMITVINELRRSGTTVLLSTHVMEQVEKLCDDIVLLNKGRVVLTGSVRDVKSRYGRDTVLLEFQGPSSFLDTLTDVTVLSRTDNRAELKLMKGHEQSREILNTAVRNVEVIRFELVEPSLNEIFIGEVARDRSEVQKEGV